jgi:hypothetical protein
LVSVPSVSCPKLLWPLESGSLLLPFPCLLRQPDITSSSGDTIFLPQQSASFPACHTNANLKTNFSYKLRAWTRVSCSLCPDEDMGCQTYNQD